MLLKSLQVALPDMGKLAPWLIQVIPHLPKMGEDAEELGGQNVGGMWGPFIGDCITRHGDGIYSFPYLTPSYCALLVDQFNDAEFTTNDDEPEEAQIPELVLNHESAPLLDCLRVLYSHTIRHLARLLFNLDPGICDVIQVARYSTDSKPGTELHTDKDSDVTLVVNLGTPHKGGGTRVVRGLLEEGCTVPSLPVGHAMFFLGRTTMHQGLPVTEGVRTLLVHWTHLSD